MIFFDFFNIFLEGKSYIFELILFLFSFPSISLDFVKIGSWILGFFVG